MADWDITRITDAQSDDRMQTLNPKKMIRLSDTHLLIVSEAGLFDVYTYDTNNHTRTLVKSTDLTSHIGTYADVVRMTETIFVYAYAGYLDDGYIKKLVMNEDYSFTEINGVEHDTSNGTYNNLVRVRDDVCVLFYQTSGSDACARVFEVPTTGDIVFRHGITFDASLGRDFSAERIDDTHVIVAYAGSGTDGYIQTFAITPSSPLQISSISSLEHDTDNGEFNSLIKIDDTHYMVAYKKTYSGANGYVKIFTIDESYVVTETHSLRFHVGDATSSPAMWCSLTQIDETHFMLAYFGGEGGTARLYNKVLEINESYQTSIKSSIVVSKTQHSFTRIIQLTESLYAMTYTYLSNTEYFSFIGVEYPGEGGQGNFLAFFM